LILFTVRHNTFSRFSIDKNYVEENINMAKLVDGKNFILYGDKIYISIFSNFYNAPTLMLSDNYKLEKLPLASFDYIIYLEEIDGFDNKTISTMEKRHNIRLRLISEENALFVNAYGIENLTS
jgi:hypothetical protein